MRTKTFDSSLISYTISYRCASVCMKSIANQHETSAVINNVIHCRSAFTHKADVRTFYHLCGSQRTLCFRSVYVIACKISKNWLKDFDHFFSRGRRGPRVTGLDLGTICPIVFVHSEFTIILYQAYYHYYVTPLVAKVPRGYLKTKLEWHLVRQILGKGIPQKRWVKTLCHY